MKRFFTFLVFMILTSSIAFTAGPEGDPAKDPHGFRNYLWGTSFETINNIEKITFSGLIKLSDCKDLEIYCDETTDDKGVIITYMFIDKKLSIGSIAVPIQNKANMLDLVKKFWGEPTSINKDGDFSWDFKFTKIDTKTDSSLELFDFTLFDSKFIRKYIEPLAE